MLLTRLATSFPLLRPLHLPQVRDDGDAGEAGTEEADTHGDAGRIGFHHDAPPPRAQ